MLGVVIACGIILALATAGTIYRLAKGPSLLDRVIATDVLLAIVGAAISVDMVYRDSYENLTLLVVVALVGFMGSVTVARFANNKRDPNEEPQDSSRAADASARRGDA
ncbi:monovalent cation/H+ antiporter complex subunit F [Rothia sp. AR01]|uniref:Monovalent cation/H+ antiporter complex subunit F n=1 Tax=Rothia santali TaxID=2949643 RepID=A0A9X2KHR8_9MICC|nr:monovalent cation/H+ antiporter complex subunit F [Rothia santali]MCP3425453.1 monovalent cation/H+ antiporter complex subunit F [Rothia santali]